MDTQLTRATIRIREMILRGRLKPGQRVAEATLGELLKMSRTPVRQALPVLAQEGLLVESETRGYVVRRFTKAEILDAIDFRGMIEGLLVRRIAERGPSRGLLRELHECLAVGDEIFRKRCLVESDEVAYGQMNGRFHELISAAGGSSIFSGALERNAGIPFASADAIAFDAMDLEKMYDALQFSHWQHHCIVEALESNQSARAEVLMREHANAVKQSINMLQEQGVAAIPASRRQETR